MSLRKGSKGPDVAKLQSILLDLGYPLDDYGIDENFGLETENAVKSFQNQHNLTVDGIVGKKTWEKLNFEFQKF